MVNYRDGEIKHIVPYNLLSPEVQALSYAIAEEKQKLLKYSAATSLYAALDEVPETVLDLMALELNTQYYEQHLPRSTKEQLVTQTLVWYMHAGTPSVLTEFLKTIMAGGYIKEWYEYDGEPYFFNAYARVNENMEVPVGYGEKIKHRINIYKNARSWLECFSFVINVPASVSIGAENGMKIMLSFFARNNQPFSFLSGVWNLNGKRYLNGYASEEIVDFYPIRLWFKGRSRVKALSGNAMCIKAENAATDISGKMAVLLRNESDIHVGREISSKVRNEVYCNDDNAGYMTKMNKVNSTWKLDGSRKLDGGRYIL